MATVLSRYKSLPYNWKFSIIAFVLTGAIGLLSMGLLGILLYYLVAFAMPKSIDDLHGDGVWPTIILVGMLWSFGFLMAAYVRSAFAKVMAYKLVLNGSYVIIIWLWAAALWYALLSWPIN